MQALTGVTRRYSGFQRVTGSYRGLQGLLGVTGGYRRLQWVTNGYKALEGVTEDYKELKKVTEGYKRLQGYKGLPKSGGRANPRRATVRKNGDRNGRRVMRSTSTKC